MADTKISGYAALTGLARDDLFVVVDVSDTSMAATGTDKKITTANLLVGLVSTASIAFTDGDTWRRVTVTDANVVSTSNIVCSIRRPDSADDSADKGFMYFATVFEVANGSFDVGVACLGWGMDDTTLDPPNETVTLCYTIG